MSELQRDAPSVLFGARTQAAHVINLMDWMGLPWQDIVLFDDAFPKLHTGPRGLRVLGALADGVAYSTQENLPSFIALGTSVAAVRYALYQQLTLAGVRLPSLIHPSCLIAPTAMLGNNVIMMPGCVISSNVSIGSLCCLFAHVALEHDTQVGENVFLGPGVVTAGFVRIGNHALLGAGAVCGPEVSVGDRTLVGAGAVVVADLPPGVVAMGVPARVHREAVPGLDVPTLQELQSFGL
jgi:acetyltransferase EpsM